MSVKEPRGRLLSAEAMSVAAGGRRLLEGLELRLAPGEVVALTGPSGAGKTVLLRTLAGLIDPAEGRLLLGGHSPAEIGWPQYRRQVVYVAQRPALLEGTVATNLARPFSYACAGAAFSPNRAGELLAALRLDHEVLEREARTLSEGEQQRVCLVRALLLEPLFLLLDEPTSALDRDARLATERLLRSEAPRRGALVVTHDLDQVERLCDRQIAVGSRED